MNKILRKTFVGLDQFQIFKNGADMFIVDTPEGQNGYRFFNTAVEAYLNAIAKTRLEMEEELDALHKARD